eukprot:TRINITY_DN3116_c0_g1_i1.p1 TRINITY_DN3116_c0_g1~~TRINITY_DN3116_c0_g1_i1.p1  ORF type:complete len:531 (+),score=129.78 TRINITY_DN3116_c0_g1_i1:38-1594(+)
METIEVESLRNTKVELKSKLDESDVFLKYGIYAKEKIPLDTSILRDTFFSKILKSGSIDFFCAHCLKGRAEEQFSPDDFEHTGDRCSDCGIWCCSSACLSEFMKYHEEECELRKLIIDKMDEIEYDVELARMISKLLIKQVLQDPGLETFELLPWDYRSKLSPQTIEMYEVTVNGMIALGTFLPDGHRFKPFLNTENLWKLLLRINRYSDNLWDLNFTNPNTAVAFMNLRGLVRHSCYPNCEWIQLNSEEYCLRPIREIQAGEEITLCLIPHMLAKFQRIQLLQTHMNLDSCSCCRCSDLEWMNRDRELSGIKCQAVGCGGVFYFDNGNVLCNKCGNTASVEYITDVAHHIHELLDKAQRLSQSSEFMQTQGHAAAMELKDYLDEKVHSRHKFHQNVDDLLIDFNLKNGNIKEALIPLERSVERLKDRDVYAQYSSVLVRYLFRYVHILNESVELLLKKKKQLSKVEKTTLKLHVSLRKINADLMVETAKIIYGETHPIFERYSAMQSFFDTQRIRNK